MAQGLLEGTKLRLFFETGLNDQGEPILKAKTFNNVKKEATVDQLFQAAQAVAVLSTYPLSKVEKADSSSLLA